MSIQKWLIKQSIVMKKHRENAFSIEKSLSKRKRLTVIFANSKKRLHRDASDKISLVKSESIEI
jgi:hypothetical protein